MGLIPADLCDDDEPIHDHFGLTYANYLVLNRAVLQSMPVPWQRRFVACLRELDAAAAGLRHPYTYTVLLRDPATGRLVGDPIPHYRRGRARVLLNLLAEAPA